MARALQLLTLAALTVQAAALDPSCGGLVLPIAELPSHYQSEVSPSFYAKFVMAAGGVPVVGSTLVSDAALIQMAKVFNWMVCKMPKVADYLGNNRVRLAVMAETEVTTDIPEHSDLGPDPWNRYRGLGHTCGTLTASAAEENLLCWTGDIYTGENIAIHELAHTIEVGMRGVYPYSKLADEIEGFYQIRDPAVYGKADSGVYASSNAVEFFAEATQAFYHANSFYLSGGDAGNPDAWTREQLQSASPLLFALLDDTFAFDASDPPPLACPTASAEWEEKGSEAVDCSSFWCSSSAGGQAARISPYDALVECGDAVGFAPTPSCSDEDVSCRYWASIGECDSNSGFMERSCQLSCGICSAPPTTAPTTRTLTPSTSILSAARANCVALSPLIHGFSLAAAWLLLV